MHPDDPNFPLGYGEYWFYVDNDVTQLDPNIVAGFFTYEYGENCANEDDVCKEIDIEISKRPPGTLPGDAGGTEDGNNIQFLTQKSKADMARWHMNAGAESVHMFHWHNDDDTPTVYWQTDVIGDDFCTYHTISGNTKVPTPGNEKVIINLWKNNADPLETSLKEIVLSRFEYKYPKNLDASSDINDAIETEKNLTELRLGEGDYDQDIFFGQDKTMSMSGGWNHMTGLQDSNSRVSSIRIQNGKLIFDNIFIR